MFEMIFARKHNRLCSYRWKLNLMKSANQLNATESEGIGLYYITNNSDTKCPMPKALSAVAVTYNVQEGARLQYQENPSTRKKQSEIILNRIFEE